MQKTPELFDQRNNKKKRIEFQESCQKLIVVGEFRWYREGVNIGHEISKDGRFMRVCFVLHTSFGNGLVLVAPLTTKIIHQNKNYAIEVKQEERYGLKPSWILVNQIKLVDRKRMISTTSSHKPAVGFARVVKQHYTELIQKTPLAQGKE